MTPGVRDVSVILYLPNPEPSEVGLLAMVNPLEVFQHTPLSVTAAPPSEVTSPAKTAEVEVTELVLI